ncbi:hypothetical protein DL96DRAFT_162610 [Flagelloscypha sp. PMI_526]|nr:hypothetical protein DL96DRAFT_162610 [Flagelloscypha sp. PMI_526]
MPKRLRDETLSSSESPSSKKPNLGKQPVKNVNAPPEEILFKTRTALLGKLGSLMQTSADINFNASFTVPKSIAPSSDIERVDSLTQDILSISGYQWQSKDRPTFKGGHRLRLTCTLSSSKIKKLVRDRLPRASDSSVTFHGQKFYDCNGSLTLTSKADAANGALAIVSVWMKHKCIHPFPPPVPGTREAPLPDENLEEVESPFPIKEKTPAPPPQPAQITVTVDYEAMRRRRAARASAASSALPTPEGTPAPCLRPEPDNNDQLDIAIATGSTLCSEPTIATKIPPDVLASESPRSCP